MEMSAQEHCTLDVINPTRISLKVFLLLSVLFSMSLFIPDFKKAAVAAIYRLCKYIFFFIQNTPPSVEYTFAVFLQNKKLSNWLTSAS